MKKLQSFWSEGSSQTSKDAISAKYRAKRLCRWSPFWSFLRGAGAASARVRARFYCN